MYTYRIEQAIRAAALLHKDQIRKGRANLPYVTHLFAVALLLGEYTSKEDVIIAGLLHDTLEDTDYTPEELEKDFGYDVRTYVEAVSEPQEFEGERTTWQERKAAYAQKLKKAPEEALMISAADKIHNMRSILEEYEHNHKGFIRDFGGDLNERALAYQDISNILNSRLKNDIIAEFNHVYTEYKNFIINVQKNIEGKNL